MFHHIFKTLCDTNMKVEFDKYEFLKIHVKFLGFIVSENTEGFKILPWTFMLLQTLCQRLR